ncbi:Mu-like prophage major head subunit gpT family protein [Brevundimonas vitis]|uniref:Mu-like prophage major head subunit gpT family protein n=1 Tax=Brevundimonas vitisensis TaxID=2800818 RepID=A0ABX7BJL5_9CAUL|nr:Mu-like prophage major head subunit gpT family protein [Brevundimonas vitisensis]QQQ17753.1 Mu-like prophage major head subunit gpT family protein [Brevundimonas vitisensis]
MQVTATALAALNTGFRNDFNGGLAGVKPLWEKVATRVTSTRSSNTYGWLGAWPGLRKWIGDRIVKRLSTSSYTIVNESYEETVAVPRTAIEDDEFGIYGPMMASMAQTVAEHPDELVFGLLKAGFTTPCYDGQNFFDEEHPVGDTLVSNMQAGAGEGWYLLDTRRPLKPLIFQDRKKPEFVAKTALTDENVFNAAEFVYGVDCRRAAGFGFWQLAFGSKAALTAENYEAAFEAMTSQRNEEGGVLNVRPTIIVVGPGNRAAAKKLFKAMLVEGGNTNTNYDDVEIVEAPWVG